MKPRPKRPGRPDRKPGPDRKPLRRSRSSLPPGVAEDIRRTARGQRAEEALRLAEEASGALAAGRAREAARAASRAKGLASRSAAIREILGLALYHSEDFRSALRELQAYRRMSGRLDQNHVIADCQRALGAPEKAVELAREAMTARIPEEARAEAAVVAGAALADLKRFDEALSLLRRFPTKDEVARPHDLRVWYVIGDVLERAGRHAEAAREFRRIIRHDPDAFDVAERLTRLP